MADDTQMYEVTCTVPVTETWAVFVPRGTDTSEFTPDQWLDLIRDTATSEFLHHVAEEEGPRQFVGVGSPQGILAERWPPA